MRRAVYITRAHHWSFEARESSPISEAEWRAYAETDPELRSVHSLPCFDPQTLKESGRVLVERTWEWVAHPHSVNPLMPRTFEYDRGGLIVRAPDPAFLRKAVKVASALHARAIGDDDQVIADPAAE